MDRRCWGGSCCLREPFASRQESSTSKVLTVFASELAWPHYILEAYLTGRWQDLYAFTLEPFDLLTTNRSIIGTRLRPMSVGHSRKLQIPTQDGRMVAVDREFKIHSRDATQTILAKTHEEYLQLLRQFFGLEIMGRFIK